MNDAILVTSKIDVGRLLPAESAGRLTEGNRLGDAIPHGQLSIKLVEAMVNIVTIF